MAQAQMVRMSSDEYESIEYSNRSITQAMPDVRPRFFLGAQLNMLESQKKNMSIYEEVEMVEYIVPGDLKNKPVKKVTQGVIQRFPKEYTDWKAGKRQEFGVELTEAPFLTEGHRRTLAAIEVNSIEDLAGLSDHKIADLGMDYRERRADAVKFLTEYRDLQYAARVEKENTDLRNRIANLEEMAGVKAEPLPETSKPVAPLADAERAVNDAAGVEATNPRPRKKKAKAEEYNVPETPLGEKALEPSV